MAKFIKPFLLFVLIIIVFHAWFLPGTLSTFDFPYFSKLMMKDASIVPYAWGWHVGLDGFADFLSPYSWVFPLIYTPQVIFGNLLGMDWSLITRLVFLYPFLILAIISPVLLMRYVFPRSKFCLLAVIIFLFNTYGLLLASGEVFLAMAYALAPIIFVLFLQMLKIYDTKSLKKYIFPVIAGLVLSLQIMNDPRITYVTMTMVALYILAYFISHIKDLNKHSARNYIYPVVFLLLIPGITVVLLNAFWIIPSILHGGNPVEALGYSHSSVSAVNYFSFAKFEDTISLLHPNWPENIFGKVDFMKPEFLLLPVLAFVSLLFIDKLKEKKDRLYVLFFAFLGLLGAFLSKGTNDPWGVIYLWLFKYMPGFIMFRDPTKWYPLVAISYTVLIPFTIWKTYELLSQKKFKKLFVGIAVVYMLFLIRPAIFGQLNGLLKSTSVPKTIRFLKGSWRSSRVIQGRFGFLLRSVSVIIPTFIPKYRRKSYSIYMTTKVYLKSFRKIIRKSFCRCLR